MSLTLVAVPIGNSDDLSPRAKNSLLSSEVVICETRSVASSLLKSIGRLSNPPLHLLNEHTKSEELADLAHLCRNQAVALICDAGTPGMSDPGSFLVQKCRELGIPVQAIPGASALMLLISLSSRHLKEFYFRGFLPAENQARLKAWHDLRSQRASLNCPVVLMDTPYRGQKLLEELDQHLPHSEILLAMDLTKSSEQVLEGKASSVLAAWKKNPALHRSEFMILLYPDGDRSQKAEGKKGLTSSESVSEKSSAPSKKYHSHFRRKSSPGAKRSAHRK